MAEQLTSWRQYLMLLGAFAGIAAVLTLVGVYGLVAYGVGQRTREIGVRRALGASTGAVLRLVLRQGLVLIGIGLAIGVTGALLTTRLLQGLLWEVSPTDPGTFVLVSMGLAAGQAHAADDSREPAGWFPICRAPGLLRAGAPRLGHQPDHRAASRLKRRNPKPSRMRTPPSRPRTSSRAVPASDAVNFL
jgi:predicted lysophospholipase L1 biosynthesis ABC-type transport system permease subunit